jgi:hypothetical protein
MIKIDPTKPKEWMDDMAHPVLAIINTEVDVLATKGKSGNVLTNGHWAIFMDAVDPKSARPIQDAVIESGKDMMFNVKKNKWSPLPVTHNITKNRLKFCAKLTAVHRDVAQYNSRPVKVTRFIVDKTSHGLYDLAVMELLDPQAGDPPAVAFRKKYHDFLCCQGCVFHVITPIPRMEDGRTAPMFVIFLEGEMVGLLGGVLTTGERLAKGAS